MMLTFEWDSRKAIANIVKHGVRFEEAVSVFYDTNALEMPDKKHSQAEVRTIILGTSSLKRILVVIFTIRNHTIRIISARLASRKERIHYEKETDS
jgi:uncharacterized protein